MRNSGYIFNIINYNIINCNNGTDSFSAISSSQFTDISKLYCWIKLQYPSNWVKQENGTRQDTQTDLVTFTPPTLNSNASLDVTVDDIIDSPGTTLAQYASDEIGSLKQQFASNDFKLIESKSSIILAGLPAYRIVYTSVDQNTTTKDMEIGAIKGGKVYLLTYEAGPNEYDKYLPIALKMIDSFKLIK